MRAGGQVRGRRAATLLISTALLAGCGGDDGPVPVPADAAPVDGAAPDAPGVAGNLIGPAGGMVVMEGATLVIPAGALVHAHHDHRGS